MVCIASAFKLPLHMARKTFQQRMFECTGWIYVQNAENDAWRDSRPKFRRDEARAKKRLTAEALQLLGGDREIEVPVGGRKLGQVGRRRLFFILQSGINPGIFLRDGARPESIGISYQTVPIRSIKPTQWFFNQYIEPLLVPPVLVLYKGKLRVTDGHHRIVHAEKAGQKTIKVLIVGVAESGGFEPPSL